MRLPRLLHSPSNSKTQYVLLAPGSKDSTFRHVANFSTLRRRLLLSCILVLLLFSVLVAHFGFRGMKEKLMDFKYEVVDRKAIPSTFEHYYELERAYPQHDASLPYPEGADGRFLWISNQHWGLGWNNIFQAMYMNAHMAYLANRAFVFQPYTWWIGSEPYVEYGDHLIPSRIPLAALIDGPMAGGSFPPDRPAPRAVSTEWFKQVCPEEKRTRIRIEDMNEGLQDAPVIDVLNKYVQVLANSNDSCVELYGDMEHPFDFPHFGDASMMSVYQSLSESPVMTHFSWSPLVLSALRTNAPDLAPELGADPPPNIIDDLMAVHIRRGDYNEHCRFISEFSDSYMGWNSMPGLGDRFVAPPRDTDGEYKEEFMHHCWPSIERIALRVMEVRSEWEMRSGTKPLRCLYVLTNGDRGWLAALKHKLLESGDWDMVLTSRDLVLNSEQKYIAQAIDMAIAERAGVLIGNGFSSLTANVVLMRRLHGLPLASNHFW